MRMHGHGMRAVLCGVVFKSPRSLIVEDDSDTDSLYFLYADSLQVDSFKHNYALRGKEIREKRKLKFYNYVLNKKTSTFLILRQKVILRIIQPLMVAV